MENTTNQNEDLDLLGNDLCLIVETHEWLINSLTGYYSYIIFNLQKRSNANDLSLINEYENKMDILSDLKLELAMRNNDIQFKKQTIADLEIQLKEVKALEKSLNNLE